MQHVRTIKTASGFVVALLLAASAHAAFRDMEWGARPAGMAGAFAAVADDSNAPAYNPAGIPQVRQTEATLMYAQLFSGLKLYSGNDTTSLGLGYLSFVPKPFTSLGNMGVYWARFSGQDLYAEDTLGVSWGSRLTDIYAPLSENVALGVTAKYMRRSFTLDAAAQSDAVFSDGSDSSAVGFDLGAQWQFLPETLPGLRLGVVGHNVNEPDLGFLEDERVASDWRVGLALQNPQLLKFTPSLEASFRRGKRELLGGVEGWLFENRLGLRGGANSREFGGGMSYRFAMGSVGLQMDYTLLWPLYVDDTSGSHRLSLTARFGAPAGKLRD